jgi:hypothetical protein
VQYIDVLFAQRDLLEARMVFIETKQQQLTAVVNTYQALGGGLAPNIPSYLPPVEDGPGMVPNGPEAVPVGPEMEPMPAPDAVEQDDQGGPLPTPAPKAVE